MASGTINTTSVNLRSNSSTSSNVLAVLIRDSAVEMITDSEDGTWLMVSATVDGVVRVGWVQSQYVSAGASQPSGSAPSLPPANGTVLRGDGSFSFMARVVGDDIEVDGVTGTWFGGANDPDDNGQTASGVSTRDNPGIIGCALPMDGAGSLSTDGSPIPKLPWRTEVDVTNVDSKKTLHGVPLIDLGPSKSAGSHAAIDLTQKAFQLLDGDLRAGIIRVNFVIRDGAQWLPISSGPSASLSKSENTSGSSLSLASQDSGHGQGHDLSKPAIKESKDSPNFGSRNGVKIDMIVMHFTDGSSALGAINRFMDKQQQVSAHYIIDRNGDIYQMVPDSEMAWHAKAANPRSIGIEHVALPGQQMADAQKASSIALVRWLVATYGIKPTNILGHRFAPGNAGTTDCPKDLFGAETEQAVEDWVAGNIVGAPATV
jgi:N-acetylmuramoyl-L-alanine amidase/Bacterial SH3 domain